ncbi:UTP--glucose-1-phosphate uridylyltransferase [Serratia symbiotica]|nr:UTP--glucose-1-phosphate uridylyltransferase [Serratia symbiotica]
MPAIHRKLRKAVIPVAGMGTRMFPATKVIPKEMLPLVDKPLIQYVVNECISAGIIEIVLVTDASKSSIEQYFDTSGKVKALLGENGNQQLLDEIQSIYPKGVTVLQVQQGPPKGLGHAVMSAYPIVGNEPFAVLLPDVIIDEYSADLKKENLHEMLCRFEMTGISQIMVQPVPYKDVGNYGIVDCQGYALQPGESVTMVAVIEKPAPDTAPSNLAIVGRYVLSANIWAILSETLPGIGDEIQLTDSIEMLIHEEMVEAYHIKGISHDCGNKLGYMQAFVQYGIRHGSLGKDFSHWLEWLLTSAKK